jgi:hypothetical protein
MFLTARRKLCFSFKKVLLKENRLKVNSFISEILAFQLAFIFKGLILLLRDIIEIGFTYIKYIIDCKKQT